MQEVKTNPSFKICLKKGLLLRPGFVVEGGERERYALKRVYTSFWDLHHNPSPKRKSWIGAHFFGDLDLWWREGEMALLLGSKK